jgi:hypothetical protein
MFNLPLKIVLAADAAVCTIFFAACTFATGPIAVLLGLPAMIVLAAGLICLPVAAALAFLASQTVPNRALLSFIALGNFGWVAASFAVASVFAATLTPVGWAVVIGQALVVLAVAGIEMQGARRLAVA